MIRFWFFFLMFFLFLRYEIFAQEENLSKEKIVVIYPSGGLGDLGFVDLVSEGIKKASLDLLLNIEEVEAKSQIDLEKKIIEYTGRYSLIIAIGFCSIEAIQKAHALKTNTKFVLIDAVAHGERITNVIFKEQDGAFLAGVVAGLFSKEKCVGFVGAIPIPPVMRFLSGFSQGVHYVSPQLKIEQSFLSQQFDPNCFANPTLAKMQARNIYQKGCDVIFAVAGGSGMGVFESAQELKKYAIGVDTNQNGLASGFILTSVLKRSDMAIYEVLKRYRKKLLKEGNLELGIKEDAVGVSFDVHSRKVFPKEKEKRIEELILDLKEGKIKIGE